MWPTIPDALVENREPDGAFWRMRSGIAQGMTTRMSEVDIRRRANVRWQRFRTFRRMTHPVRWVPSLADPPSVSLARTTRRGEVEAKTDRSILCDSHTGVRARGRRAARSTTASAGAGATGDACTRAGCHRGPGGRRI